MTSQAAIHSKLPTLIIGGGAREHALAESLARSQRIGDIHVTHHDNPGLASIGKHVDVPVSIGEIYRLKQYCDRHRIGLVVIGPEAPLAEGYADELASESRLVFGPRKRGAMLESDKVWAKQLMRSASIPTAEGRSFTSSEAAIGFLESRDEPHVVKASGLAAGKGVLVPTSLEEATKFVTTCLSGERFGDAGKTVLIEEMLTGPEVSVLALVDGRSIYVLETAQDHKRLLDADLGPNTGGMGAISPSTRITDDDLSRIERDVLVPTVDALKRDGIDFRGVLYAGLMLTPAGPKVLEYNVRFGDPECQAVLSRLKSDLGEAIIAACTGSLADIDIEFDTDPSCCVVLAAEGYPEAPRSGDVIEGIESARSLDRVSVFHAGTRRDEQGRIVTAGGRVLSVVATGSSAEAARERAYEAAEMITFRGKQFRTDIGATSATRVS
ncbi:MAG: phosphoribosylamine--glycine ligase [Planctomycetota bacterium]